MKALSFKIPKPESKSILFQKDIGAIFYDKLHQHEEIQLSIIISGEGDLVAGDRVLRYSSGSIFVIGSYLPHFFKSDVSVTENSEMLTLFFTQSSFGSFIAFDELTEITSLWEEISLGVEVQSNKEAIHSIFSEVEQNTDFERLIQFLSILKLILHSERRSLSTSVQSRMMSELEGERMQRVMDYAMNHFKEPISLDDAATCASMTRNSFCRYFKQRTNKSFFQFLNEVRLEHASTLLKKNADQSIDEIAELSGFRNISNFNRQFKSYRGMTPRDWRKE